MKRLSEVDKKILKMISETRNPITLREISEKMNLKTRSTNIYLQSLRRIGFVTLSGDGYIITVKGKETMGFPKIDEQITTKILNKLPQENAFYFYIKIDQPLGVSSDSFIDLCEKIRSIDIRSIEFHIARGDFESWINYLGDFELANRLKIIKETGLTGEALREKLNEILKHRYDEILRRLT